MNQVTIYAESYGCSSNKYDYELLLGQLHKAGYIIEKDSEKANIILVNTCAVKKATEDRILRRLQYFASSGKPLIITGCLPKTDFKKIVEMVPLFSAMVDPFSLDKITEAVSKAAKGVKQQTFFSKSPSDCTRLPQYRQNRFIHIAKISEGCIGACSYCCAKFARGQLHSYPLESIINNIKRSIIEDAKEIYITSQDTGCYGMDNGLSLIDLLEEIKGLSGDFKVRLGMMTPNLALKMIDDLLEIWRSEKFFKFVHIPVQSGSDTVLKEMNRQYKVAEFVDLVKRIRDGFHYFTIATDIIVGFPTESANDFNSTIKLVEKTKPDIVNISRYGHRKGTISSNLPYLPTETVNQRSRILTLLCSQISLESNKNMIGKRFFTYVTDANDKGTFLARASNYKRILLSDRKELLGKKVRVKVAECTERYLLGELSEPKP